MRANKVGNYSPTTQDSILSGLKSRPEQVATCQRKRCPLLQKKIFRGTNGSVG